MVILFGLAQYLFADRLGVEFFLGPERRSARRSAIHRSWVFLIMVLPLAGALMLWPGAAWWKRGLLGALILAGAGLVVLTQARSSLAGLVLAIALFPLALRRNLSAWVWRRRPVAGAVGLAAFLLVPGLKDRLAARSMTPRIDLRPASLFLGSRLASVRGRAGGGTRRGNLRAGDGALSLPRVLVVKSEDIVPHAHNEVIELAVEYGGVGVLLTTATAVLVAAAGVRALRRCRGVERLVAAGVMAGLAGALLDNMANVSLRQAPSPGILVLAE